MEEIELRAQSETVTALAFSPHKEVLASGDSGGKLIIWDGYPLKPQAKALASKSGVNSISFEPGGQWFATGCEDHTIQLWDLNGKKIRSIEVNEHPVKSVAIHPGGMILASGGGTRRNGELRIWATDTGKMLAELEVTTGTIRAMGFTPDGKSIV